MLRLILLSNLLLAGASAVQQPQHGHHHHQHQKPHFYCDDAVAATAVSGQRDFLLTTRARADTVGYSQSLSCDFNAVSETSSFLVEIQSFSVSSAVLTVSSGSRVLFRGSSLQRFESSMVTPSGSLRVQFEANGDTSQSSGVTLRVRSFSSDGCPPDWTSFNGACFGTSRTSGQQDFGGAQRACNRMRANLMQLPPGYTGSLRTLVRALPMTYMFSWVGLTDLEARFTPRWMNGRLESSTSEISCDSHGTYATCFDGERCATVLDTTYSIRPSSYAVFMAECQKERYFICSMPPGGTNDFYPVPSYSTIRLDVVIPVILVSLKLLFWLIFLTRYAVRRYYLQRALATLAPAGPPIGFSGSVNDDPKGSGGPVAFEGPGSV